MKYTLSIILLTIHIILANPDFSINKIEPPNWWAGMKWNKIQLMIYGENLKNLTINAESPDISILEIVETPSHKYLFLEIQLSEDITPGKYVISINSGKDSKIIHYHLEQRDSLLFKHMGFDQSDIIYLITPDRFVNGDTTNDIIEGYDQRFGRQDRLARHGGDIEGIISKLEYLKDFGVTSIWINPLLENNMFISYYGYSTTDFYNIDPRFGSNDLYKKLVSEAHKMGIKIIMDHVSNHVGDNHPWIKCVPFDNWINGTKENHLNVTHHKTIIPDIHAPFEEKEKMLKGWFMDFMPDLNQANSYLSDYLIQNTIWWIEYSGIDGIREDTYPYVDQHFLSIWAKSIFSEYPNFKIIGEIWDGNSATLSYFQTKTPLRSDFDTFLPYVTDFRLMYALGDLLREKSDLNAIYHAIEQDFIYKNSNNLLTFIDNHDVLRAAYLSKGINNKLEIALGILFTTRGIPQIYYGTEIGIIGDEDHGDIREDFPGGFPGDKIDLFNQENHSYEKKKLYKWIKNLIRLRKNEPALQYGSLTHYPVENNIYVYKRIYKNDIIYIFVNGNDFDSEISIKKYHISGNIIDIINNKKINIIDDKYILAEKNILILKIKLN
ncbi:MAG: cyclomaltodextrinase N-terminal domain-containing protein [Calditrichaceae bacterium]|nr:cyclomaltodextrinase N-terminal domain-containing protein [Calditrichaceae bacterium]RQV96916.1 MAG: alpha-amlyase [Calditrichota bacterium]